LGNSAALRRISGQKLPLILDLWVNTCRSHPAQADSATTRHVTIAVPPSIATSRRFLG
jgi:hypothetical protein